MSFQTQLWPTVFWKVWSAGRRMIRQRQTVEGVPGGAEDSQRGDALLEKRIGLPWAATTSIDKSAIVPEKWVDFLLIGAVVSTLFSIFVSGVLFGLTLIFWGWDCSKKERIVLRLPPFAPFLGIYVGMVLVSIAFSPDFVESVWYLKKFVKFVAVLLLFTYLDARKVRIALYWIYGLAGASALWALVQYLGLKNVHLLNRIDGFMSHWMTFSGQMMLVTVSLVAFLLRGDKEELPGWLRTLFWALVPLLLVTIILTYTRSAWVGTILGIAVILALTRTKWLLFAAAGVVLLFVLLPGTFHERLYSAFDREDTTTRGRIELARTGWRLVETSPWTGVGPRLVPRAALQERQDREVPPEVFQHLHNNVLQIAAELGLLSLAAWLALWTRILWDLFGFFRRSLDPFALSLTVGALGLLAAFHFMGLFEYNFGDSEVAILLFFLLTAPYVAAREDETQHSRSYSGRVHTEH